MNSIVTKAEWHARAQALCIPDKPFINGRFVFSRSDSTFSPINPATGEEICKIGIGSSLDVDEAVTSARDAYEDGRWRSAPPLRKKQVLLRIADLIEQHGNELALLDVLEMGKTISNAKAELAFSSGFFRYYAEAVDKLYGDVVPSDPSTLGYHLYEPRGVVGAITPWNFPLIMASLKAAPILAAGNSLVLKPSEVASTSTLRLAELAVEAGLPPGVFNVVPGLGRTVGEAIGRHMDVDMLSFTGSTRTGRQLLRYSGESNGKALLLELGGKSPQVVGADMRPDLEAMVAQIIHEAFWNQGQWCVARSRLIVEESFHDELVDAIVRASEHLVPGDTLDPDTTFGAIATLGQMARVRSYIDAAHDEGARLLSPEGKIDGCFMAPIVFGDVSPTMKIAKEEIFGPVLSVLTFKTFDEALRIANDTSYGLAATVWTKDMTRAHAAVRALRAGKLAVRSRPGGGEQTGFALSTEPWGSSGFGVEGGMNGLRSYCRLKGVEFVCG